MPTTTTKNMVKNIVPYDINFMRTVFCIMLTAFSSPQVCVGKQYVLSSIKHDFNTRAAEAQHLTR